MAEANPGPNIIPAISSAKQVRSELTRFTRQEEWGREDYWIFFLRGRRKIFDEIYDIIPDKDWLKPDVAQIVEQKFIEQAYMRWGGPGERWILEGGWMLSRPDIVTWMRSTYWKHNKPRRVAGNGGFGSAGPAGDTNMTYNNVQADRSASSSEPSATRNWKDIVLLEE